MLCCLDSHQFEPVYGLLSLGNENEVLHNLWGVHHVVQCDIVLHGTCHDKHTLFLVTIRRSYLFLASLHYALALCKICKVWPIIRHVL